MTNRFKAAAFVGLATVFLATGIGSAAAELQECFRDGYLCSVQCDKAAFGQVESQACQARCNAEEKVCVGKIASRRPTNTPRYSPVVSSARVKPFKAAHYAR